MDITPRQPSGTPTGGQFAQHSRDDSEVKLPAAAPVELRFTATLPANHVPLPEYPQDLPEPSGIGVTYGDDHPGVLYSTFTIGEGREAVGVTVWTDEDGDRGNSIWDGDEETGWDSATESQFLDWAYAMNDRMDTAASWVRERALDAAAAAIINHSITR